MPKSVDSRYNMGALRARNVPTKIINIINTPSSTNGITSERFIANMWVKQVIKEGGKNLLVFKNAYNFWYHHILPKRGCTKIGLSTDIMNHLFLGRCMYLLLF